MFENNELKMCLNCVGMTVHSNKSDENEKKRENSKSKNGKWQLAAQFLGRADVMDGNPTRTPKQKTYLQGDHVMQRGLDADKGPCLPQLATNFFQHPWN